MLRPSFDETWLEVAQVLAKRGTCVRRKVGCVLTDRNGICLGTGYNGTGRLQPHCISSRCSGATLLSGTGLDNCLAIHAEQNALLSCVDTSKIHNCYTTTAPCIQCVKMLLNTECQNIIFMEEYPHLDTKNIWEKAGRNWIKI